MIYVSAELKGRVVPVYAMMAYRGRRGAVPSILDGGEGSASCPSHFTPRKEPW